MDISMPGINGIEAARQIVIESPRIKVITLSMHSDSRFVKEVFQAGASGYLLKDVPSMNWFTRSAPSPEIKSTSARASPAPS